MTVKLKDSKLREPSTLRTDEPLARSRVDPRIRQRRVEVIRAEGRRRLRILLAALGLLVFVAVAWAFTRSPFMDLDTIDVVGTEHTTVDILRSASGLRTGQAMTDVDVHAIAARIRRLPWVTDAVVERHWLSSITITVVERVPVAAIRLGGDPAAAAPAATTPSTDAGTGHWALVDSTGRVLELVASRPADLVAIFDLEGTDKPGTLVPASGRDVLAVAEAVPPSLRSRVAGVRSTEGDGGIEILLEGDASLVIGSTDRLAEKFQSALTILARVNTSGLQTLDVRVPDSPVLTRRGESG